MFINYNFIDQTWSVRPAFAHKLELKTFKKPNQKIHLRFQSDFVWLNTGN